MCSYLYTAWYSYYNIHCNVSQYLYGAKLTVYTKYVFKSRQKAQSVTTNTQVDKKNLFYKYLHKSIFDMSEMKTKTMV